MESNNKKRFLTGLATGLSIGLILGIVMFFIYLSGVDVPEIEPIGSTPTPTTQAQIVLPNVSGDIFEGVSNNDLLKKINEINYLIESRSLYGATGEAKLNAILDGLVAALNDKYADYYTPEELKELFSGTSGVYCGVGAVVSLNEKGEIYIVRLVKESPAAGSGLCPNDIVIAVGDVSTVGMSTTEAVTYIKGEEGTEVSVTVLRNGEKLTFSMVRRNITNASVDYEMLDNKVGYIEVTEFDETTGREFSKAIDKLEEQGMTSLVIDMRNNPGGLVTTAVQMVDRIIKTGIVVYTMDKDGNRTNETATTAKSVEIPIAVLVNGNSASASEIFTGALQDYGKAIVVGTQSFGKGIVQGIWTLSDGAGVKFTISEYYTPNGNKVHGVGITPDVVVELDSSLTNVNLIPKDKDNQLKAAIDALTK